MELEVTTAEERRGTSAHHSQGPTGGALGHRTAS